MSRRASFSAATSQDQFLPILVFRSLFHGATKWSSGHCEWRGPSPGFRFSIYCMNGSCLLYDILVFSTGPSCGRLQLNRFRSSRTLVLDIIYASGLYLTRQRTHIQASIYGTPLDELHTFSSCDGSRILNSILVLFVIDDVESCLASAVAREVLATVGFVTSKQARSVRVTSFSLSGRIAGIVMDSGEDAFSDGDFERALTPFPLARGASAGAGIDSVSHYFISLDLETALMLDLSLVACASRILPKARLVHTRNYTLLIDSTTGSG